MGCLKLSYRGQGEGVGENPSSILWEVYKKGGSEEKKSVEYYRYGFQGEYAEEDSETGWNSFQLRMYDPVIGRWLTTDPYDEFWSPYLAMGNDPVNLTDPDGGMTDPPEYAPQYLPEGSVTVTASRTDFPTFGFLDFNPQVFPIDITSHFVENFAGSIDISPGLMNAYNFSRFGNQGIEPFYFVDNPITVASEVSNDLNNGDFVLAAFTLITLGKGGTVKKITKVGGKFVEVSQHANDIIRASIKRAKQALKGFESGRHDLWMKAAAKDLLEQAKISKKRGDLPELWEPLQKKGNELLQRARGTGHRGGGVGSR